MRIPPAQLEILQRYPWPGNIRELENVIERQVIVTQDRRLVFDDLLLGEPPRSLSRASNELTAAHDRGQQSETTLLTEHALSQRQRESTLAALSKAGGKVSGAGGAAELLGIKPTTLTSRLNKWGIDARDFRKKKPRLSSPQHALD